MSTKTATLLLMVLIAAPAALVAQVDTGTISGLVRDASGAGIPAVHVKITDESTGLATELTTNPTGLYVSPPLRAGNLRRRSAGRRIRALPPSASSSISRSASKSISTWLSALSARRSAVKDIADDLANRKRHAVQSALRAGGQGPAAEQPELRPTDHAFGRNHAHAVANHRQSHHHEARGDRRLDRRNAPGGKQFPDRRHSRTMRTTTASAF